MCKIKFLLKGLERCKVTQMKACNITVRCMHKQLAKQLSVVLVRRGWKPLVSCLVIEHAWRHINLLYMHL